MEDETKGYSKKDGCNDRKKNLQKAAGNYKSNETSKNAKDDGINFGRVSSSVKIPLQQI
ncbi:MAG: hypothetical protein ACXQT5_06260 [Candidatus Syntropharchaeia archaeon]